MARRPVKKPVDDEELETLDLEREEFEDENEERDEAPRRFDSSEYNSGDTDSDLQKLLTDLGGSEDAECRVYQQPGNGQHKMAYIFNFQPGDYTFGQLLEKIKNEYGGGDYRLHIRSGNAIITNRAFSVAKVVKPQASEQTDYRIALEQERQRNADQRFEMVIENMRQQQAQTLQMIQSMNSNREPPRDPLDMMTAMMAAMEGMKKMAGLDEKRDPYKELERILSLRDKIQGDTSEREPTSGDILLKAINQFGPLFNRIAEKQGDLAAPARPPLPAPSPNPVTPRASAPETSPQTALMASLLQHSHVLLAAASRGGDPYTYVGMVLDFTDEVQIPYLYGFALQEHAIDFLIRQLPEIGEQRPWFETFRKELVNELASAYPELIEPVNDAIRAQQTGPDSGQHDSRELTSTTGRSGGNAGDTEIHADTGAPLFDRDPDTRAGVETGSPHSE